MKQIRGRTGIAVNRTRNDNTDFFPAYWLLRVNHDGEQQYYVAQIVRNSAFRELLNNEVGNLRYPAEYEYSVQVWDAWPIEGGSGDPTRDHVWDAGNPLFWYQVPNDVGYCGAKNALHTLIYLITQGALKRAMWRLKESDQARLGQALRAKGPTLHRAMFASELTPQQRQQMHRLNAQYHRLSSHAGTRTSLALDSAMHQTFQFTRKLRRQPAENHVLRALRAVQPK